MPEMKPATTVTIPDGWDCFSFQLSFTDGSHFHSGTYDTFDLCLRDMNEVIAMKQHNARWEIHTHGAR